MRTVESAVGILREERVGFGLEEALGVVGVFAFVGRVVEMILFLKSSLDAAAWADEKMSFTWSSKLPKYIPLIW